MENTQPTKTESASEKKEAILDDLTKSGLVADTEKSVSSSLSNMATTATTPTASPKTWTSAELAELRRAAGLVAGALSDFQTAGGLVVVKSIKYQPREFAVKIYLVADGLNIMASQTADGIDLVAAVRERETK